MALVLSIQKQGKIAAKPLETRNSTTEVRPSDIANISDEWLLLLTASMLHLPYK